MNLSVTRREPYAPKVEFVERKGAGHPDTICDEMAERLARRLATEYVANTGAVQHFNVDKAVLAAGTVEIGFGGGRHVTPGRLILVGKADSSAWRADVEALIKGAEADLEEILPDASPEAFEVDIWLSQSAADLVVVNASDIPLANDTSFAAVSLPRSRLEAAVHLVEQVLNGDTFRSQVPIGRDIKVMGATFEEGSRITVAAPVMAGAVDNRSQYDETVMAIQAGAAEAASEAMGGPVEVRVNQADLEDSPYLTMSGSSAESGDDGQVGRGNRFGGLITPYRPMSLEAAAGKNPAAHVGKTYHAVAQDMARRVIDEAGANEVTIRMLSSIGNAVTEPQTAHIEVNGDVDDDAISAIAVECLADWGGVRDRLIAGEYELF